MSASPSPPPPPTDPAEAKFYLVGHGAYTALDCFCVRCSYMYQIDPIRDPVRGRTPHMVENTAEADEDAIEDLQKIMNNVLHLTKTNTAGIRRYIVYLLDTRIRCRDLAQIRVTFSSKRYITSLVDEYTRFISLAQPVQSSPPPCADDRPAKRRCKSQLTGIDIVLSDDERFPGFSHQANWDKARYRTTLSVSNWLLLNADKLQPFYSADDELRDSLEELIRRATTLIDTAKDSDDGAALASAIHAALDPLVTTIRSLAPSSFYSP